jgi:hypothetical protein
MNERLHELQQGEEDGEGKEKPISSTLWYVDDRRQRAVNALGLTLRRGNDLAR